MSGYILVQLPSGQVEHLNSSSTVADGDQRLVLGPVPGGQWWAHAQGGWIWGKAVVDCCQHHVYQQL